MHIGIWDGLLLIAVALMATAMAYIHNARVKALLLMLPIPFSLASLSLGSPVDATNVLGVLLLYCFVQVTRFLHLKAGIGIVASIVTAAIAYCLIGWGLASVVPKTEGAFWVASFIVLGVGLFVHFRFRDVDEPGHRSLLPIWLKLPTILAVVGILVFIKTFLQGFMTLFPMVTVIGLYESRHSLATTCRKVGTLMFIMLVMLIVMRIAQRHFGLSIGMSLVLGWIVYMVSMVPVVLDVRRKTGVACIER